MLKNLLLGKRGATRVFGLQKGMLRNEINIFEGALKKLCCLVKESIKSDYGKIEGAGAAGGLGFALLALGGNMKSGAEYLLEKLEIKEKIAASKLVITSEGRSDMQTLFGKVPTAVASLCKMYSKPVILISGSVARDSYKELMENI